MTQLGKKETKKIFALVDSRKYLDLILYTILIKKQTNKQTYTLPLQSHQYLSVVSSFKMSKLIKEWLKE